MKNFFNRAGKLSLIGFAATLLFAACQPVANNTNSISNANSNTLNANSNLNSNANLNGEVINSDVPNAANSIETKEPEKYRADVTLRFETTGANAFKTPPLKAQAARDGADRRMEFALPAGEKIIYLTKDGKQYLISPARKQIAELNKESLGIAVQDLMMPEQIINQIRNLKGIEKIGEEKVGERDAIKYRYNSTTDTQTKAGNVSTESYILVDKETGLPLRSVTDAASDSGNVQGIKGLKFITEINNIKETVDPALFELPTDYKQVEPEVIRQQVNTLFNAAVTILSQVLKAAQPDSNPKASPNP